MSTHKDPNQIAQDEHDETVNAKRVVIVGGSFDSSKMQAQAEMISKAYTDMAAQMQESAKQASLNAPQATPTGSAPTVVTVPEIVRETVIERVEVPVIVKEQSIQRIEVPVIVKEMQLKEIQVPIITTEIKLVEVPLVLREAASIEIPMYLKLFVIVSGLAQLGLVSYLLLK